MWGELCKDGRCYKIIAFEKPDTLILKGSFAEFETSLHKSYQNGYTLEKCDELVLNQKWQEFHS